MQLIAFVPSSGQSEGRGLAPYTGAALNALHEGDTVWLVTRMPDDRGTPGLCGRIVVSVPQATAAMSTPAEPTHNIAESERCAPFPCDTVLSWPVWRTPFEGMAPLTDEQAACLETFWAGSEGRRLTRPEG